jgi:hypothetical protein
MSREIIIDVTEEDIREGIPSNFCWCPFALAANRAFGRPVEVGTKHLALGDGYTHLPVEAIRFIAAFDAAEPVRPSTFTIRMED